MMKLIFKFWYIWSIIHPKNLQ